MHPIRGRLQNTISGIMAHIKAIENLELWTDMINSTSKRGRFRQAERTTLLPLNSMPLAFSMLRRNTFSCWFFMKPPLKLSLAQAQQRRNVESSDAAPRSAPVSRECVVKTWAVGFDRLTTTKTGAAEVLGTARPIRLSGKGRPQPRRRRAT